MVQLNSQDEKEIAGVRSALLTKLVKGGSISASSPAEIKFQYDALLADVMGTEVTDANRKEITKLAQAELKVAKDGVPGRMTVYGLELARQSGGIDVSVQQGLKEFQSYLKEKAIPRKTIVEGKQLAVNEDGVVMLDLGRSENSMYTINGKETKIEMGRPGNITKREGERAMNEFNETGESIQRYDGYPTINGGITWLELPLKNGGMHKFGVQNLINAGVKVNIEGNEIDLATLKNKDLSALQEYQLLQYHSSRKLNDIATRYGGEDKIIELDKEFQEGLLEFHYNLDTSKSRGAIETAVEKGDGKKFSKALPSYRTANGVVLSDLEYRRAVEQNIVLGNEDKVDKLVGARKGIFDDKLTDKRVADKDYMSAAVETYWQNKGGMSTSAEVAYENKVDQPEITPVSAKEEVKPVVAQAQPAEEKIEYGQRKPVAEQVIAKPAATVAAATAPAPEEKVQYGQRKPITEDMVARPAAAPVVAAKAPAPEEKIEYGKRIPLTNDMVAAHKPTPAQIAAAEPPAPVAEVEVRAALNPQKCQEAVRLLTAASIQETQVITPDNAHKAKLEVYAVQTALNAAGHKEIIPNREGKLDNKTLAAVADFESRVGLTDSKRDPKDVVIDADFAKAMTAFLKGDTNYAAAGKPASKNSASVEEEKPKDEKLAMAVEAAAGLKASGTTLAESGQSHKEGNFAKANLPVMESKKNILG